MKYYAHIDGQQRGPYTLEELHSAGVTPDTYVWTKGMQDWMPAGQVPDICRYFRQHLGGQFPAPSANGLHDPAQSADAGTPSIHSVTPSPKQPAKEEEPLPPVSPDEPITDEVNGQKLKTWQVMQRINEQYEQIHGQATQEEEQRMETEPPHASVPMILFAIICFPLTGLIALALYLRSRRTWKEATDQAKEADPQWTRSARHYSYALAHGCRMMTLISYFLGVILYAALAYLL